MVVRSINIGFKGARSVIGLLNSRCRRVFEGTFTSSSVEIEIRDAINPMKIKKRIIDSRKKPSIDANIILKNSFIVLDF
jgi:hypothetical protein